MHLPAKQRVYAWGAVAVMLGGMSYVGLERMRPVAPLSVEAISGSVPPLDGKPTEAVSLPPKEPASTEVVVAMAGAVKVPGLIHLPPGARVDDAIKAAGGAKPDADLEAINLAAKAVDGDQIYVPPKKAADKPTEVARVATRYRGGEVSEHIAPIQPIMPPPLGGSLSSGHSGAKPKASGPVSLSTGSLAQLETLPGVGPATAQKILDYRMEHGGFTSVDEIQAVKGIGPKKFEKMRPFLKR